MLYEITIFHAVFLLAKIKHLTAIPCHGFVKRPSEILLNHRIEGAVIFYLDLDVFTLFNF